MNEWQISISNEIKVRTSHIMQLKLTTVLAYRHTVLLGPYVFLRKIENWKHFNQEFQVLKKSPVRKI